MAECNRTHDTTTLALCLPDSEQASRAAGEHVSVSHAGGAAEANERRHRRVIDLLAEGRPLAEIEAATGCRPRTIRQIAQRYREVGPEALVDRRQRSSGAAPLLPVEQQRELGQALQGAPPEGGAWNGPKVARWIAARTGKHVHRQRGWEYLRRLGGAAAPASAGQSAAHAPDDEADQPA